MPRKNYKIYKICTKKNQKRIYKNNKKIKREFKNYKKKITKSKKNPKTEYIYISIELINQLYFVT